MRGRAFSMAMLPAARWSVVRRAIALGREFRVELGRRLATAHGLHVGDQVDQVFDSRIVRGEPHRVRAGERQAQGELGLGEPAIELMPEQPARHRIGEGLGEEDAVPRDQHVVEPHLAVELVEAGAERRGERVGIARRGLAADHGDAGRIDRDDEGGAMAFVVDAVVGADIDVVGEGRAGVHADLAADHQALVGLLDDLERRSLGGILAQAIADGRGTGGEGEEAAGARDQRAIGLGIGALLGRGVALVDHGLDAHGDQMAVGRRMGDVAGAEEGGGGEAAAHAGEILGGARHHVAHRRRGSRPCPAA